MMLKLKLNATKADDGGRIQHTTVYGISDSDTYYSCWWSKEDQGEPRTDANIQEPESRTPRVGSRPKKNANEGWKGSAKRMIAGSSNHPVRLVVLPLRVLFLAQLSMPIIRPSHPLFTLGMKAPRVIGVGMIGITCPTRRIFSFRLDDQLESFPIH